jgi:hypothetical protein
LLVFDLEEEQLRRTYQVCRLGFGITAVALVAACFTSLVSLLAFVQHELFLWVHQSPLFQLLETPIVWLSLFGATLLWGRWDHVSWQRRAGLLLLMCLVDLACWFVEHGTTFGLENGNGGHEWLRIELGQALGWAEFALLSSLSCAYLVHLGVEQAREYDKSTRSMAVTGALIWLLWFCQQTDWAAGWPLRQARRGGLETMLLWQGTTLIWAITLIHVTALVIKATRQSTQVLEEMDRYAEGHDLLRSRSDSMQASDLLKSQKHDDDSLD